MGTILCIRIQWKPLCTLQINKTNNTRKYDTEQKIILAWLQGFYWNGIALNGTMSLVLWKCRKPPSSSSVTERPEGMKNEDIKG